MTAADLSKKTRASLHGCGRASPDGRATGGAAGALGMTGATGAVGSNGASGAAGTDGAPGVAGSNGAAGSIGGAGHGRRATAQNAVKYFAAVPAAGTTLRPSPVVSPA